MTRSWHSWWTESSSVPRITPSPSGIGWKQTGQIGLPFASAGCIGLCHRPRPCLLHVRQSTGDTRVPSGRSAGQSTRRRCGPDRGLPGPKVETVEMHVGVVHVPVHVVSGIDRLVADGAHRAPVHEAPRESSDHGKNLCPDFPTSPDRDPPGTAWPALIPVVQDRFVRSRHTTDVGGAMAVPPRMSRRMRELSPRHARAALGIGDHGGDDSARRVSAHVPTRQATARFLPPHPTSATMAVDERGIADDDIARRALRQRGRTKRGGLPETEGPPQIRGRAREFHAAR